MNWDNEHSPGPVPGQEGGQELYLRSRRLGIRLPSILPIPIYLDDRDCTPLIHQPTIPNGLPPLPRLRLAIEYASDRLIGDEHVEWKVVPLQ